MRDPVQKDPIFLLRSRVVITIDDTPVDKGGVMYEMNDECDWECVADVESEADEIRSLDDSDLLLHERAIFYYEIESVWFTREEARKWGQSHSYRFGGGKENVDWDVYAVSAKGDLAAYLRDIDNREGEK